MLRALTNSMLNVNEAIAKAFTPNLTLLTVLSKPCPVYTCMPYSHHLIIQQLEMHKVGTLFS